MKKIFFMLVLGLGLISLSACSLTRSIDRDSNQTVNTVSDSDAAPIVATSTVLSDGSYQVDTASSRVAWRAAKVVAAHTGLVTVKSGSVEVSGGAISGASLVMDMSSISSDQKLDGLVKHLKSADFFDVAVYPESKLVIKSVQPTGQTGEYAVNADLTIKGVSAPVDFKAQIVSVGDELDIKADFSIDRTKWGIKYGSGQFFKDLGDQTIEDEIKFQVDVEAAR